MIVTVDQELCNNCGICGDVCPRHIPETVDEGGKKTTVISQERVGLCMECGHCSAVCPKDAIKPASLKDEDFAHVQDVPIDTAQFLLLLKQRRSVRRYKDKPIPREIINQLIEAADSSPTGTGKRTTGVIVIDNPRILSKLSELSYEMYENLGKNLRNPIARFFIKQREGMKTLKTLVDFVMPGMHWYIRWFREGAGNEILRDCPALMLFHSPLYEPVGKENCIIAAFHAIMMAQVMKIGTCFNDLIPPACNRIPEIKHLIGLSSDREVNACITMGYAQYKFRRIVPRRLAEVRYLD